mgnify:CR=1 FL=1
MEAETYLCKAVSNEAFAKSLEAGAEFNDWIVTAHFYTALHYVNAYLSSHMRAGFCSHEKVKTILSPYGAFHAFRFPEGVFADYLELQNLSRRARYLKIGDDDTSALVKVKPRHAEKARRLMESVRAHVQLKMKTA